MEEYFHSVRLNTDKCRGCVNCIKRCPTEAIRIRQGKALIIESRCIDCGECIRYCPNHAKSAVTDCLDDLKKYKYNIALPAPSLYAQFSHDISVERILFGLLSLGFNEVYEVAYAAEIVSGAIQKIIKNEKIKRPVIASSCPAVVRLIQVKYPELIGNILPIEAPVELAARIVKSKRTKELYMNAEDIGVWFITPCPAKVTTIKQPIGLEKSYISGAIGISQIYGDLLKKIAQSPSGKVSRLSTAVGQGWALAGGDAAAAGIKNALVVHDIQNVSEVLEQVTLGKLSDIEYIEGLACAGGCIGGPLTVENRFVAEQNMKIRMAKVKAEDEILRKNENLIHDEYFAAHMMPIQARSIMTLDDDIVKAMKKLEMMDEKLKELPGLDCGSCGSPNCKALAEDIVQGTASETDCVFKLRERVKNLAQEMFDLAQKLPPSLSEDQEN